MKKNYWRFRERVSDKLTSFCVDFWRNPGLEIAGRGAPPYKGIGETFSLEYGGFTFFSLLNAEGLQHFKKAKRNTESLFSFELV